MSVVIFPWKVLLNFAVFRLVVAQHESLELCVNVTYPDECDYCVRSSPHNKISCGVDVDLLRVRGRFPYFEWNSSVVDDPENMTLTFYWYPKESKTNVSPVGYPVPGCCGMFLEEGNCSAVTCVDGHIYYWVQSNDCIQFYDSMLPQYENCYDSRNFSRYLFICPNKTTAWMERLYCVCIRYDTFTGTFVPSNDTLPFITSSYNVWFDLQKSPSKRSYDYACVFSLAKETVMSDGELADPHESMESWLFRRGVYNMFDYHWFNGSVINARKQSTRIKCDAWTFNGSSFFELTSTSSDNNSFTCVIFWPNGTDKFRPFTIESHVKCMPKNATYGTTKIYVTAKNNTLDIALTIGFSVVGGLVFVFLIACLICKWRRTFRAFINETKSIPEQLKNVASDEPAAVFNHNDAVKERIDLLDDENTPKNTAFAAEENKSAFNTAGQFSEPQKYRGLCHRRSLELREEPAGDGYRPKHCLPSTHSSGYGSNSNSPLSGESVLSRLSDCDRVDSCLADCNESMAVERKYMLPLDAGGETFSSRNGFDSTSYIPKTKENSGAKKNISSVYKDDDTPLVSVGTTWNTKVASLCTSKSDGDQASKEESESDTARATEVVKTSGTHDDDQDRVFAITVPCSYDRSLYSPRWHDDEKIFCRDVDLQNGCSGYLCKETFRPPDNRPSAEIAECS